MFHVCRTKVDFPRASRDTGMDEEGGRKRVPAIAERASAGVSHRTEKPGSRPAKIRTFGISLRTRVGRGSTRVPDIVPESFEGSVADCNL